MRKSTFLLSAIVLAYCSPWLASPDDGLILSLWFNGLPMLAALWVGTDNPAVALAVDVGVSTVQYLAFFVVVVWMRPLVNIAADFVSAPRHRRGLVR